MSNPYDIGEGGLSALVDLAGKASQRARASRYARYRQTMKPAKWERILDLGCGGDWSLAALDPEAMVTGVDLTDRGGFERPNQRFVKADACNLPFEDDSFDLGYSNSLIEHIPRVRRQEFASELRRTAKRYWVQTPNFWFPLEPHALLPGVQYLPHAARRVAWRASPRHIEFEEHLALLTRQELAELFDDAIILSERVGPLTKSLIAVGPRALFRERP